MNGGGYTLIARYSNADSKNWMQRSGSWWYDRTTSYGSVTSTSDNNDMLSPAFWLVQGDYIKISRNDDSSNTALLYTSSCTGDKTFRSFITSFGDFRHGAVWNKDACRGSCYAYFGGSYSSTVGFHTAYCSGDLKSGNSLSFWCDWGGGDGAVLMVGGGGNRCGRAGHGIAVTEAGDAQFGYVSSECGTHTSDRDFGFDCSSPSSYSLNLWLK